MRSTTLFVCALALLVVGCLATLPYEPREDEDNSYLEASDGDSRTDVSDERSPHFASPKELPRLGYVESSCPTNMFMRAPGRCHPCAVCGPDLYELKACTSKHNTVCDWCLNPNCVQNSNYRVKCADLVQLQDEFDSLLEKRHGAGKTSRTAAVRSRLPASSSSSSSASSDLNAGFVSDDQLPMRITFIRPIFSEITTNDDARAADSNGFFRFAVQSRPFSSLTYKLDFLLELVLYVALLALLFALVRFVMRARTSHYRTVTVQSPVLNESDKKNIIRAADEIREKLGTKNYNRLEEFI